MAETLKMIAKKLLGICTKLVTATGPLGIIRDVFSITTIVVGLIKLIRKIIAKIKSHKKSKQPETVAEFAMANETMREAAPDVKERYEASVEKTANKLIGKPKKRINDSKKLKDMLSALDEISEKGNRRTKVDRRSRNVGVSELLDSDPVLHAWAFGKPATRKVCHS